MLQADPELRNLSGTLGEVAEDFLQGEDLESAEQQLDSLRTRFRRKHYEYRESTVEKAAQQLVSPDATLRRLDAIRWLHRVTYHFWRIVHHIRRTAETGPAVTEPGDEEMVIEEDI
jgi:phosphate:Na+ symporter